MTALIEIGLPVAAVVVLAVTWVFLPHGGRHASRPARRGPAAWARAQRARAGRATRAARRAAIDARRLPGTAQAWWAARHQLPAEDQQTVDWLNVVHEDPGPRWWCVFCQKSTPNGSPYPFLSCAECGRSPYEVDYSIYLPEDAPGVAVLDEAAPSGPAATLGGPDVRVCSGEQVTWRDSDPLGPSDCGEETRAANRQFLATLPSAPTDVPGREMGSAPWPAPTPDGDPAGDGQGTDKSGIAQSATGALSGDESAEAHKWPPAAITEPRTAGVEPGPEPGTPPADVRDPVPAGRQWAIDELTGQHLHADTGAFPKVKGVA